MKSNEQIENERRLGVLEKWVGDASKAQFDQTSTMQASFLYAAIADVQATIRATDPKIALLMVILAIPLTKLGSVFRHCSALYANQLRFLSNISLVLIIAFVILWLPS